MSAVSGTSDGPGVPGVRGDAGITDNDGVQGFSESPDRAGVIGVNKGGGVAVKGDSPNGDGVQGFTTADNHSGVVGSHASNGTGVLGQSNKGVGVHATSNQVGLVASGHHRAAKFDGIVEMNNVLLGQTINGTEGNFSGEVFAKKFHPTGADFAEDFAAEDNFDPGTVLVIGDNGLLTPCGAEYDKRATGVVSGAGGLTPGIVMDGTIESPHRVTVALAGTVYVKADPQYGAISPGDLLTTSSTQGCAMRVSDHERAAGAVLGKALASLDGEPGLLRMLVRPS